MVPPGVFLLILPQISGCGKKKDIFVGNAVPGVPSDAVRKHRIRKSTELLPKAANSLTHRVRLSISYSP
jgi:hypothetical protein